MNIKQTKWHRLAAIAVTGATMALPIVGATGVAQADPYAPGWGFHQVRGDYGPRVVVGIITRHLHGNYFELRADNGRFLQVIIHEGGPVSFGLNERVELTGHFDDGNFIADTVRFLREDRREAAHDLVKIKFNARVLEIRSAHHLTVRSEYGRVYEVDTVNGLPDGVRLGDQIRVIGYGNDHFMRADTIRH